MSESPDDSEYEWHFKLSAEGGDRLHPDALTEMARQQVKALLSCVVLTTDGVDLRVTGFRFLADPDAEHAIYADVLRRSVEVETPSHQQGDEGSPGSGPQGG